jgi:hypothetical protein
MMDDGLPEAAAGARNALLQIFENVIQAVVKVGFL